MTDGMNVVSDLGFNIPGNKTAAKSRFLNVSDAKTKELNQYFVDAAEKYTVPVTFTHYISETRFETILSKEFSLVFEKKQTLDKALSNAQSQVNDIINLSLKNN